uniref:Uncharacterized protein n=1 Tax=Kalanchoe fedtschenkoi TaxID=63787 RepID=A0A7N0TQ84_KALFE
MKPAALSAEDEALVYASSMAAMQGFVIFMNAAIELNLFDIISNSTRPLSALEIASHLPKQNPEKTPFLLDRMLRLFTAFSLLDCTTEQSGGKKPLTGGGSDQEQLRLYALSQAGKYFVKNRSEGSVAPLVMHMANPIFNDIRCNLKDAIMEGVNPCERTCGMPLYQVLSQNPATRELLNTFMAQRTTMMMNLLLENYHGFDGVRVLVDVGGSNGASLKSIVSAKPHIRGVNFDLPHVVKNASPIPGITHVGGDFFAGIPKGDAIMLKNVLHNWDDENCVKLLKRCYEAISAETGKVVVIELIMPGGAPTGEMAKNVCLVDCMMLFSFDVGARERSEEEFLSLGRAAGFSEVEAVCLVDGRNWVIEFRK